MNKIKHDLFYLLIAMFSLLVFGVNLAYADTLSSTGETSAGLVAPFMPLLPILLMMLAFACRKYAPENHWLHTPGGMFAVGLVAGALDAIAHAIQQGGVHQAVIVSALVAFLGSLLAQSNPLAGKSTTGGPQ
jgi:hypothetical protein